MKDQASNLRILAERRQSQYASEFGFQQQKIILTSGKGGVGKSFLCLHLAQALANSGEKVLLVDGNLTNPSLHIITNTDPIFPIHYWMNEATTIDESAIISLWPNLDMVANTPSSINDKYYFYNHANVFLELLRPLSSNYSYVVMDTQTGMGEWNLSLMLQADLSLMLSITDPTSVIDTYIMIKAVLPHLSEPNLQLVVNQVIGESTGMEAFENLNMALKHFLNFEIPLLSIIPFDLKVRQSVFKQEPLWISAKRSDAMQEIKKMVHTLKSFQTGNKTKQDSVYQEINL